jgi:26S proteasome regulatory subunit T4
MDGFDSLGRTKLIMATNQPDTLDLALLHSGHLDHKIEVPLPNEQAHLDLLKIMKLSSRLVVPFILLVLSSSTV